MVDGPAPERVSHLTFHEMLGFGMQLRNKVEIEWQRVVNVHAALIGVMIFFAGQTEPYTAARIVVFVFYSFNVLVSFSNLRESYNGLRHVSRDMMLFSPPSAGGDSIGWIRARTYRHDHWMRSGLLAIVWAVVFYLMILPLWLGRTPFGP